MRLFKVERIECELVLLGSSLAAYNAWVDEVIDGRDYNEKGMRVLIAVLRAVHPNCCQQFSDTDIRESIILYYREEA